MCLSDFHDILSPELIRLQHSTDGLKIYSNTVINIFQRSSDYNYPDYGEDKRNGKLIDYIIIIIIRCHILNSINYYYYKYCEHDLVRSS